MDSIELLTKKLSSLEEAFKTANEGIPEEFRKETLKKIIQPGGNEFQFGYNHIFECLKKEFTKLNTELEQIKTVESINDSTRTSLNNRVRNILTIMIDLLDEKSTNKTLGKDCGHLKEAVKNANMIFRKEHDFFRDLSESRNSLCHIHDNLTTPYQTDEGLLQFVQQLQKIEGERYLNEVESALLAAEEKARESIASSESSKLSQAIGSDTKKAKLDQPKPVSSKPTSLDLVSAYTVYNEDSGSVEPKKDEPDRPKSPDSEGERRRSSGRSYTK